MKQALCVFLFALLAGAFAIAQNAVPFVLQPLRPMSATPGMTSLTLTVTGTGFVSGATVNWNGSPRATTFVSSTKLTASITSADLAHAGTAMITVANPAPGGGASNVVFFPVHQKSSPGGFARKDTALANGASQQQLFVADFNNDGKLDVVTGSSASGNPVVEVFLGNGDGTFQAPVTTIQSIANAPVAIGDFNGDGKLDVIGEGGFGTVLIYLGNGDGTFTEQPTYYTPSPATYSVADLNGDGKLDLVVSWSEDGASGTDVWFGNGDGTFNDVQSLGVGAGLVAVSDYNRDGKLDLAIPSSDVGLGVDVAMGRSNGVFNTPVSYMTGPFVFGLWAADLNNDGKPDLVSDAGLIFMNNGNGTFTNPSTASIPGTNSVVFEDINGDGKLDMYGLGSVNRQLGAAIYLGNGDGTFQAPINFQGTWGNSVPAFGDFNGDGRMDYVMFGQDLITGSPVMSVNLQNNLQISQTIIQFGITKLGTTLSQTSMLTNTGNTTLNLGTIGLVSGAPNYSVTSTCGSTLVSNATCSVTLNFSPKAKKLLTAKVKIPFTGTLGGPQYIEANGQGD
jgi:hypothetical protein